MDRRDFLKCSSLALSRLLLDQSLSVAQMKAQIQTRGAYSSPQSFWEKGLRLDDYGINAIFVHSGSIDEAMVQRARNEGARVFAEFATFNGSDWLTRREGDKEVIVEERADGRKPVTDGGPGASRTSVRSDESTCGRSAARSSPLSRCNRSRSALPSAAGGRRVSR